jgi:hypothetical protein
MASETRMLCGRRLDGDAVSDPALFARLNDTLRWCRRCAASLGAIQCNSLLLRQSLGVPEELTSCFCIGNEHD